MSIRQLRLRVKHLVLRAQECTVPDSIKHQKRVRRVKRWARRLAAAYVQAALEV